jgi:aldose 1-epimerase
MDIKRETWGAMPDGREAELFFLTNQRGMTATVTNYGATLVSLTAPDKQGAMADVVLGYETLGGYIKDQSFMGCTVGRVANRISRASFELDGQVYALGANLGEHQLHGGATGFHTRLWDVEILGPSDQQKLMLTYRSVDGEEGYPGNLDVSVVYTLTEEGLRICYRSATDKPTVVNLANHAYFNLSGSVDEGIGDHVLTLNASSYLMTDDSLIPSGEVGDVSGTPLDFTRPKTIGLEIDVAHEFTGAEQGYDHCFVIDGGSDDLIWAAQVFHGSSGRVLDVYTTQHCVQFYSGNHLSDSLTGKLGAMYSKRQGFCLETQGYVDAPNRVEFPAVILKPGEKYKQVTEYRFSTM